MGNAHSPYDNWLLSIMTSYFIGFGLALLASLVPAVFFYARHIRNMANAAAAKERLGILETQLADVESRAATLVGQLQAESASRAAAEAVANRV